jgi:hypothetical protein
MKTRTAHLIRLCAAALITATAACSGVACTSTKSAPAPTKPATPAAATLMQQIQAEIGDASCDAIQQCRTLPVGHRACGGPESFLAYSTARSDPAKLLHLATQDSAARKEQNERSGMMSTCEAIMDPGATCSAGRCVAGNARGGALPAQ